MGRGRRVEAVLSEFPEPSDAQRIVRVTSTPGGNLLRVEDADGTALVVRMPSKTKNNIWVRTGAHVPPAVGFARAALPRARGTAGSHD